MKLSFPCQTVLSLVLLVAGLFLSLQLGSERFYNLSWTLVGLLFLCHPVFPRIAAGLGEKKAQMGIRIAAAVILFIGLTNGFGV